MSDEGTSDVVSPFQVQAKDIRGVHFQLEWEWKMSD